MGISTAPAVGARGAIHVGEETVYGAPVRPTHLIDFTSESLTASETVLESASIRSDRGRHKLIQGNLDIAGDISFEQSCSGFGMLIRHALGDYVKVPSVDGGMHARVALDSVTQATAVGTGSAKSILKLADDTASRFEDTGAFHVVRRDATSNDLTLLDNGGSGWAYDGYNPRLTSYVLAVDPAATSGGATVTSVTVAQVYDAEGNLVDPEFSAEGGIVKLGADRQEYIFVEAVSVAGGVELFLHPDSVTANGAPLVDSYAFNVPTLVSNADFVGLTPAIGDWVYQYDANFAGVYTHHIERGARLPIGLTVEIDRDAAIFLYTGNKINTMTVTFETNAIVTGTFSLMGRDEYAIANLLEDVLPGAKTIQIENARAFPDSGILTIGEETNLHYSSKVDNGDGTFTVTLTYNLTDGNVAGNEDKSIERFHFRGSNVDSRSSTKAATVFAGNTSPLTSFETQVYIDGSWEEVLSGSLTLTNNLNDGKFGLGSKKRLGLVEQQATVEAQLSLEFDDGKHYKKFIEGEFFSLEFRCISDADDSEIGETGVLSQAYYYLPKCKYNGTTPNIAGTEYITYDAPITAIVDDDLKTTDLVVILVNGLSEDVEA